MKKSREEQREERRKIVSELIKQGFTRVEIADYLQISRTTLEKDIKSLINER